MTDLVPDDREDDAETVHIIEAIKGGPVDPPDAPVTVYGTVTSLWDVRRVPIVPAWLRNHDQRKAFARQLFSLAGYLIALHVTRSPKYALKTAWYAPRGAWLAIWRPLKWASAEEGNWHLRQRAATRGDDMAWLTLDRHRQKQANWRWLVLGTVCLVLAVALSVASVLLPPWVFQLAAVVGVLVLARMGRPADKPILDRVVSGRRFTKLTGEMVRAALVDLGVGVKEPGQITFPPPGVHTDGPGWLARFNLPGAIVATKVLEKRDGLAAALRLPIDQVWPEVGPDHPGQVDLWVGYMPASKMGQPTWELTSPTARTSIFDAHPFGTDARQRPICCVLFERNFLIGGQPGSGKSYAARTLATIAALDPTCELKIAEFKGTGDFLDMAPLCTTYTVGVLEENFAIGREIIAWALAECERRGKRILAARERGEAPQGKVTPELARKRGSGLHPVFILLDEVHELFAADPAAAEMCERAIKRGRALGIIFVLATQIPDKDSLPPNITRCVTVRWCLSVGGQVENDMILGTGAYKRGLTGTVYRPGADAGWGVMVGLEKPGPVRSFFPAPDVAAAIVARATQLRGGVVGDDQAEKVQARDMLADVRAVFAAGERGLHWETIAERLAEQWPDVYDGMTAEMVRVALARYDVESVVVNVGGTRLRGARLDAIDEAEGRREVTA